MRRFGLTLIFAVAAAALCSAQEQSLGDLARHKSSSGKAAHVYTDEDIPTHPVTAAPEDDAPASAPDSQGSGADKQPAKSSDPNATPDKPASPEVEAAKKVVKDKQVQIDYVSKELNRLHEQLLHETDDNKADSLQSAIRNLEHNIGAWTQQRDGAQKVIDKAAENDKNTANSRPASGGDSAQPRQ